MSSKTLQIEIDALQEQLSPMTERLTALRRELGRALSIEWIAANGVTKANVLDCNEKGLPYFGHVSQFADYLRKEKPKQRWATWNGVIHSVAELQSDKFIQTNGRYDDLPKETKSNA